jgi:hypothetical protein
MKTKNIKTIIAFAQSRGMMAMSVVEVIKALNNMKPYRRPITRVHVIKYPKMAWSWCTMETFLRNLKQRKEGIAELLKSFGINASIEIGGSLSLKYQLPQFYDREFHDVDMVIHPRTLEDMDKLRAAIRTLIHVGVCKSCSAYYNTSNSFMMGEIGFRGNRYPVNILIGKINDLPFEFPNSIFNSPYEVFEAKKAYIKASMAKEKCKRAKDIIDLYKARI